METAGEALRNQRTEMTTPLAMMTSPAAMAVRAMRLANAKEDIGDTAGMLRNVERAGMFMSLPGYSYDEFMSLGGMD